MNETFTYCENIECDIMSCTRNPNHLSDYSLPHKVAHLEDNPLYCKKGNWNGYQVKEAKDE